MDGICEAFTQFAHRCIAEGITDAPAATARVYELCPSMQSDKIFNHLFDTIFMLELVKTKIGTGGDDAPD